MSELRAVVFDVEGVIAFPDVGAFRAALDAVAPDRQLAPATLQAARNSPELYPLWVSYSVGGMTPAAYWTAVLAALDIAPAPHVLDAWLRALQTAWWGVLDAEILGWIGDLRANHLRVAALSNSCADHDTAVARLVPLLDVAHFSHRTGTRKPDAAAYRDVLAALGVPPTAVLFIDDKVRNTAAAERAGMRTHVFVDRSTLAAALIEAGALPKPVAP